MRQGGGGVEGDVRDEVPIDEVVASVAEALADIADGSSLAVGGFGLCGVPVDLVDALVEPGMGDLACGR